MCQIDQNGMSLSIVSNIQITPATTDTAMPAMKRMAPHRERVYVAYRWRWSAHALKKIPTFFPPRGEVYGFRVPKFSGGDFLCKVGPFAHQMQPKNKVSHGYESCTPMKYRTCRPLKTEDSLARSWTKEIRLSLAGMT